MAGCYRKQPLGYFSNLFLHPSLGWRIVVEGGRSKYRQQLAGISSGRELNLGCLAGCRGDKASRDYGFSIHHDATS